MISEFDVIKKYFTQITPNALLGVGDDCALLKLPPNKVLATSTDTLIQGVHFFSDTNPYNLGHKCLAVNLSDLAAMGAKPLACLLNLALPSVDTNWLEGFSKGFFDLANSAGCDLIGGDTTRSKSELSITVTVMGTVKADYAMTRSAAVIGDDIWLTGTLGAPHIALLVLQDRLPKYINLLPSLLPFLEKPIPPSNFAENLGGIANAAIDISDGLMQDLGHILNASNCAAEIVYEKLPVNKYIQDLPFNLQQQAVLSGGDVFQLCFTADPMHEQEILNLAQKNQILVTKIGSIFAGNDLKVVMPKDMTLNLNSYGYDHFK